MSDIKITASELNDSRIDEIINLEKSLSRSDGEFVEDVKTPFHLNPIFYYAVAASLGAFIVWLITEQFYTDNEEDIGIPFVSAYLLFGPVAGTIGLLIGFTYGIANRNIKQALYCGIVGVGVGLGATIITTIVASISFGISTMISAGLTDNIRSVPEGEFPFKGVAFFVFMCGRGLAWCIVSVGAGLGLGVALKSKKLLLNGLAGGMVGGVLGGMLFDPISRFISGAGNEAALSRGVGITAIGLLVGFFIGLFENVSKDAWFLMLKGPLTGKQFILFKSPMMIGSAPKCDIYLFKDPDIEPQHASITKSGSKYILKDNGSENGTYVNGKKLDKYILQVGDVITIGETVLKYSEKEKR